MPQPPMPVTTTTTETTDVHAGYADVITIKYSKQVNGSVVSTSTESLAVVNLTEALNLGTAFTDGGVQDSSATLKQILDSDVRSFQYISQN
jgi:hypothetical protein